MSHSLDQFVYIRSNLNNSVVLFTRSTFLKPFSESDSHNSETWRGFLSTLTAEKFASLPIRYLKVMESGTNELAITELVIYTFVLLSGPIFLLSSPIRIISGIGGSVKWPSITLLALLHIIGSAYQISTNGNANDAIEIMDSVGLFLILLAFSGVLEPL